jgi:hypothetical protein
MLGLKQTKSHTQNYILRNTLEKSNLYQFPVLWILNLKTMIDNCAIIYLLLWSKLPQHLPV